MRIATRQVVHALVLAAFTLACGVGSVTISLEHGFSDPLRWVFPGGYLMILIPLAVCGLFGTVASVFRIRTGGLTRDAGRQFLAITALVVGISSIVWIAVLLCSGTLASYLVIFFALMSIQETDLPFLGKLRLPKAKSGVEHRDPAHAVDDSAAN
ncbi:MAG: hypothetical protein M9921_08080 [Fimbriimonadaceae bacterium]|nr:hypothetical protein [Chthonomonadaceae bacterium]MCO5296800.1 hypothetical protein [Fimbriimonadaceae bacterium]